MSREPRPGLGGEAAHHAAYLSFLRDTVVAKATSLPEPERRRPHVPSGWTVVELVQHLACVERRWFVWGFLGEPVDNPWEDSRGAPDGPWFVAADRSFDDVVELLRAHAVRTDEILRATSLDAVASTRGRFRDEEPPDLRWICFHVLQEYARHLGHLDLAAELAGGPTGE